MKMCYNVTHYVNINFIRIHEFPEVSNNGERQEIMGTTAINLFKTF